MLKSMLDLSPSKLLEDLKNEELLKIILENKSFYAERSHDECFNKMIQDFNPIKGKRNVFLINASSPLENVYGEIDFTITSNIIYQSLLNNIEHLGLVGYSEYKENYNEKRILTENFYNYLKKRFPNNNTNLQIYPYYITKRLTELWWWKDSVFKTFKECSDSYILCALNGGMVERKSFFNLLYKIYDNTKINVIIDAFHFNRPTTTTNLVSYYRGEQNCYDVEHVDTWKSDSGHRNMNIIRFTMK